MSHRSSFLFRLWIAFLFAVAAPLSPAVAQAGDEMLVATREAPPFAMKTEDGEWSGIAIELWRSISDENDYEFRFVEAPLSDMIEGVEDGRYAASVGALTITPERESRIDFTHPYYATGFGIAVRSGPPSWLNLVAAMFSRDFLMTLALLVAMLTFVGVLFWLAERRHNAEEFPEEPRAGIGAGFWFSAVTMTTVGYGDKSPRSVSGRIVALVWMFSALIVTSVFTGLIASALTAGRLGASIAGPQDLDTSTVGAVAGSAGQEWLSRDGIASTPFETVEDALAALKNGEIDAFVDDYPLLRYSVRRNHRDTLEVLAGSFGRQDYAIALPEDSLEREAVNLALLHHIESDRWLGQLTTALESSND